MRIRHFIAAIMILLSLTAQARAVSACGMMPGAALAHCCCPAQAGDPCPSGPADRHCCNQLDPAAAPVAHAQAAGYGKHHRPIHPVDPPVAAPRAHLLSATLDPDRRSSRSPQTGAALHRACPLYLATARLRL
jgi:hypothetical protein